MKCISIMRSAALAAFAILVASAPRPGAAEEAKKADPYPLGTCIVSGDKLGEMGEPITKTYDGREVKFCCGACPKKFEADKAGFMKKIDAAIIEQQKAIYPTDTCVVSGKKLGDMGDPLDVVSGNRLVRLCCAACEKGLKAAPAKFIAMLDEKVIEKQKATYPLDTCAVSGTKLNAKPIDVVVAGRLVRLCCKDHEEQLMKNPAEALGKIDAAAKAKGAK